MPETKQLPCGCIVEKVGGKWWAYSLCKNHKTSYYKNPKKYLEEINQR